MDSSDSKSPPEAPPIRLACASCQQRKVKCDRTFPCNNCSRRGERCVAGVAVLPKQRRKRFAERELLERLRHYEDLLRDNNIKFEPLHRENPERKTNTTSKSSHGNETLSPSEQGETAEIDVKPDFAARKYWTSLNAQKNMAFEQSDSEGYDPDEGFAEGKIRDIWAHIHRRKGHTIPFGQPVVPVDLSGKHPEQVTIFRLWQAYLDNVDPLLKVTHTPTLQPRIIGAGSNVATIQPSLDALMFSIYCLAILSLSEPECFDLFSSEKEAVLMHYQMCCQQALANCGILCTRDREVLTAMYLYLLSIAPGMDPQSTSSLMGIPIRIARRMNLHSESSYAKLPALEAELRRRLWWSMVLLDSRVGELAGSISTLVPTWDCHIPLNVNDFELQNDMQSSPTPSTVTSEAIFPVIRSDISDYLRHTASYLDFVNPALKDLGKRNKRMNAPVGAEMSALAREIEDNYLVYCNPENSLHFMTLWTARMFLARAQLLEHYSTTIDPAGISDKDRDAATSFALSMLEYDTKLMTSPLSQKFKWYLLLYLPLPAYFQILLDLKKRPSSGFADRAWQVMSNHYAARSLFSVEEHYRVFKLFSKIALRAWKACEEAAARQGRSCSLPTLILELGTKAEEIRVSQHGLRAAEDVAKLTFDDGWDTTKMAAPQLDTTFSIDPFLAQDLSLNMDGPSMLGVDLNSFDFDTMDWNPLQHRGF